MYEIIHDRHAGFHGDFVLPGLSLKYHTLLLQTNKLVCQDVLYCQKSRLLHGVVDLFTDVCLAWLSHIL